MLGTSERERARPPTAARADDAAALLAMQRSIGNRATAAVVSQRTPVGRGLLRQPAGGAAGTALAVDTRAPPPGPLPTRQQLDDEVDRLFRGFFPKAPGRLDPNDPGQEALVSTWLGLRDQVLDDWTDRVFFSFFPYAPKALNPADPADAQLIEFWTDIRDQIRDGGPGRYHWGPAASPSGGRRPHTPAAPTTTSPASPSGARPPHTPAAPTATRPEKSLRVVDVHNYGNARVGLDFDSDVTVAAAAALVFPGGVPAGVELHPYGPHRILLEHVTGASLSAMPPWLAKAFMQASQGIEDDPGLPRATPPPAPRPGEPHPEIDIDTPEKLKEWVKEVLDRGHEVGDVAELAAYMSKAAENIAYRRAVAEVGVDATEGVAWGGRVAAVMQFERVAVLAEVLEVVAGVLSTIGDIFLIFWVGFEVIETFKEEKEDERRFGYLYGLMWEVLGEPDHMRVCNGPGITYSAEEHRAAFVEGAGEGRKRGKDAEISRAIKLWVAASAAAESRFGGSARTNVSIAAATVITELWEKQEKTTLRFPLAWPTPYPYEGVAGPFLQP
jgi:hypothetical protein